MCIYIAHAFCASALGRFCVAIGSNSFYRLSINKMYYINKEHEFNSYEEKWKTFWQHPFDCCFLCCENVAALLLMDVVFCWNVPFLQMILYFSVRRSCFFLFCCLLE